MVEGLARCLRLARSESFERSRAQQRRKSMRQKRRFKSQGFGPIGEAEAGTKGTEGPVAGDEGEAGGEGRSGNEHVQGGEGAAVFPGGGTRGSVAARGGGCPEEELD